jgi:Fe-S-cluster-containing dehydrogenase component
MGKVFVIDIARCSGCYNCQIACKDEHCGNDWRPYAAPQPDTGQFWMHLDEHIRGTIPKVKMHYLPHLCNHCRNAPCIDACPETALERRGDGLVLLLPNKCTGCRKCMSACPYDVIFFNETLNIAQKCTGCAHLLDNGDALPRCVGACPTEAIRFGEETELTDLMAKASVLKPELECAPAVYYLGIPGRFIAGTVYDPVGEEIVRNAECVLTGGGKSVAVRTDGFGDFWFKELEPGVYDVAISARGFAAKRFKAVDVTERDMNLGDIPLGK